MAAPSERRRLDRLLSHFLPYKAASGEHYEASRAGVGAISAGQCASVAPTQDSAAGALLDDESVAGFLTRGYLKLELGATGELSQDFCERFHETSWRLRKAPRTELWAALSEQVNVLLTSPSVHAALVSLLGEHFLAAPGNSHMHGPVDIMEEIAGEQGFHKDGTDHGPTMGTVRDHRTRHLLLMFYPHATPMDWGPTAVLPGSQFANLNRWNGGEHAPSSEQGFELPHDGPPHPVVPPTITGPGDIKRIEDARALLGDPTLEEEFLTCPAGTLVIAHHHIVHRGTRRAAGIWRPMHAIRNVVRTADPIAPTWDSRGADPETLFARVPATERALYESMWNYMNGSSQTKATVGDSSVASIKELLLSTSNDNTRLGQAYKLGMTAGGSNALLRLLEHDREEIRRAAGYGLTVAPAVEVLPSLLSMLEAPPVPPSAAPHLAPEAAALPPLVHVLGTLAAQLGSTPEGINKAVAALQALVDRTILEITVAPATVEVEPGGNQLSVGAFDGGRLRLDVIERRRVLAEAGHTAGHLGVAALRAEEAETAGHAAEILVTILEHSGGDEPGNLDLGSVHPSFMTDHTVQQNAATGVVRLCSAGAGARWGAIPALHGITDEAGNGGASVSVGLGRRVIRDLVVEAAARLAATMSDGGTSSGQVESHGQVSRVLHSAMQRWGWSEPEVGYVHVPSIA